MKCYLSVLFTLSFLLGNAQSVVPIEIAKSGHIFVKATVNGVEGNFIFDTAGGTHVVSKKFYQKIKSAQIDSSYFAAFRHTGERLDGPIYQFREIKVGSVSQSNAWIGVYAGFDNQGFDGLISLKLIEQQPVTIDIKNKQMIIESAKSLSSKKGIEIPVILHADRNRSLDIFMKVQIGNQYPAWVEFDTGAGYSPLLLHSRYITYSNLDTTKMEIRQAGTGFGKTEKIYFDKSKQLNLYVTELNDGGYPNIVFKPSLIYDGLTSHVIFGDRSWTIDLPNQRLIVYQ